MSDDQFTRLFRYMQHIHADMEDFREEVRSSFDRVYGILDAHEKRVETLEHEQLAMKHQLTRHEDWINRADHASVRKEHSQP